MKASLAATVLCACLFIPATAAAEWEFLAPFPKAMTEIVGVASAGKLYVVGGLEQGEPLGLMEEYDERTDRWIDRSKMPVASHHVMVAQANGKVYVFGGFVKPPRGEGWYPVRNAWQYDPALATWKAVAPMPTARGAGAAVTVGDRIYVIGGATLPDENATQADLCVGTVEEYDPGADRWRSLRSMPTARNHFTAVALDGRIYAMGGRIGAPNITQSSNTDVVEQYDVATDQWKLAARMPSARSGTAGVAYAGRIYVAGGEYQTDQVMMAFKAVDAYDPNANRWEKAQSMRAPRHGLAGALLGRRFHVVGGDFQSAGVPGAQAHLASHEAFDFAQR